MITFPLRETRSLSSMINSAMVFRDAMRMEEWNKAALNIPRSVLVALLAELIMAFGYVNPTWYGGWDGNLKPRTPVRRVWIELG